MADDVAIPSSDQDSLVELADILIEAHDVAQTLADDELKSHVTRALFRIGQLLGKAVQRENGGLKP